MSTAARTYQGEVKPIVDGQTTAEFRYELNATSEDAIILWLEEKSTKKQWQSSALGLSDFVTNENGIPKATLSQYAELFVHCLAEKIDASTRHLRAKGAEGGRVLVLGVPISLVPFTVIVEYEFPLALVPLERVDLLGARMRDMEENHTALLNRMTDHMASQDKVVAGLEQKIAGMEEQIGRLVKHMEKRRGGWE